MNTNMNQNINWEYDRFSRHYVVRNTKILFANFAGAAKQYNQEGRRNFNVVIPEDFADELKANGIYIHTLQPRNDDEDVQYTVKVGVYPDADIRLVQGSQYTQAVIDNENKDADMGKIIDAEFQKGRVLNGEVKVEFHISRNTKIPNASPYLRVDILLLPIRRSMLEDEFNEYMSQFDSDTSDPFDEDED